MMKQPSLMDRPIVATDALPAVVEPEPEMTTELAVVEEQSDALTTFAQIGLGIEAAKQIAVQLSDIVKKQKLSVTIKGKEFLFVEAWCTCGAMCGLAPRTVWCRRITDEKGTQGYEARVEVIRLSTDQVVSAAETECWMDERLKGNLRWTEKHVAKSMAQTRGTSKAIAQILRWIPILAGYSGTPAEEADGENGMPPMNDNPEHDQTAPRTAGRDDRVTKEDIAGILARWRAIKGRPGTASEWAGFVLAASGREFDVHKQFAWTPADIKAVDRFLREHHDG